MEEPRIAGFVVMNHEPGAPVTIVGLSGGKDSTAVSILAIEQKVPNLIFCFNDTGNEHPLTYEYIAYLKQRLNLSSLFITKADFTDRINGKREYVIAKWAEKGVPQERIDLAIANLKPSGNPFLDMAKWKGRFPSTKARFCTQELKVYPFEKQLLMPLLRDGQEVIMWTGVRAEESPARAALPVSEYIDPGYWMVRPIHKWTAKQVFAYAAKNGVNNNPLYSVGMARVGCMPCIMSRKSEIREIGNRYPEVIDRLESWEAEASTCTKGGFATFLPAPSIPLDPTDPEPNLRAAIRRAVEWARTTRGGVQYDIFADEAPTCSSIYGLCE